MGLKTLVRNLISLSKSTALDPGVAEKLLTVKPPPGGGDGGNAYNPIGSMFDPRAPLPPFLRDVKEPARTAVPVGYNLTWSNTKKGGIPLLQLRSVADTCYGIRIVIESMKRQMRSLKWDIGPKDKGKVADKKRIQEAVEYFRKPDGEHFFSDWLGSVMEELLVAGVMPLARLSTWGGDNAGLAVMDGCTLTPIWTSTGRLPEPPNAAFYQVVNGVPLIEYDTNELIYRPFNLRSWTPYGLSPVEQTMMLSLLLLESDRYFLEWFKNGNVPPAFMRMPDEWANQTNKIDFWEQRLTERMADMEHRHQIKGIPKSFEYTDSRQNFPYTYDLNEYVMRIYAWCVGVSCVWIIKTSSLGQGSDGLNETAIQEGLKPYQTFVEETLDEELSRAGFEDLTFRWVEEVDHNAGQKLTEDEKFIANGTRSRNEIREERGLDPIDHPAFKYPALMTMDGKLVPVIGGEEEEPPPDNEPPPKEPPNPEDQGKEAAGDLAKWSKKAKNSLKQGKGAQVSFNSAVIPSVTADVVKRALSVAYSAKAVDAVFQKAKKGHKFIQPDYDNMPEVKQGEKIWLPILKDILKDFIEERINSTVQKDGAPKNFGIEEWNAIVEWLEGLITMGAVNAKANMKAIGIKEMAELRAAALIGKRWDNVSKVWIDSPVKGMAISDSLRQELNETLAPMLDQGASIGEMTEAVEKTFGEDGGVARALRIARSEAATNYNQGTLAGYKSRGVTHVIVHDGDDAGACEECAAVNGEIWTVEEAAANPIEHPNCVRAFEDIEPEEAEMGDE